MSARVTSTPLTALDIRAEADVVATRRVARELAERLGFKGVEATRVATAVSELARNAFMYAQGGRAEFFHDGAPQPALRVRVADEGPGIPHLAEVLGGGYRSARGLGMGLVGTRRLADRFDVQTSPGQGTRVEVAWVLPRHARPWSPAELLQLAQAYAQRPAGTLDELAAQNAALLQALDALQQRQAELDRLNRELEETNRGVVALHAELEEKADALARASEHKSRFLSSMSHELRTPLNSILSLSRLLEERVDGPLTGEQERQVLFIRKSAQTLRELIDDLLDLAKIEAGKTELRPSVFTVGELLGALRGTLRPLLTNDQVELALEADAGLPPLFTDEGKLAQVLRNLVSNALKYTERGEVRVSAGRTAQGWLAVAVRDTGIGIAPEHHERIFEEFTQVEGPLQARVKGTGLGLPLSRRLAELLGGSLGVQSEPGRGSTFTVLLPPLAPGRAAEAPPGLALRWRAEPGRPPLLVLRARGALPEGVAAAAQRRGLAALGVASASEAREALGHLGAAALVAELDEALAPTWAALRAAAQEAGVPAAAWGQQARADEGLHAGALTAEALEGWLGALAPADAAARRLLVVDDDEVSRYLVRRMLEGQPFRLTEAASGPEGLARALEAPPDVLLLDLVMPEMSAHEVLDALRADPRTAAVPVVVQTAKALLPEERARLLGRAQGLVAKQHLTRELLLEALARAAARAGR